MRKNNWPAHANTHRLIIGAIDVLEIYAKAVVTAAVIVVVVIVALQTFCRCVESAIIFAKSVTRLLR